MKLVTTYYSWKNILQQRQKKMALTSSSILSTKEFRPILLLFCTLARRLTMSADSSWQASVHHHFVSFSHASSGQL
jgi:hypothetical protein